MACLVNPFSLLDGSMIHPHNDILPLFFRRGYRHWLKTLIQGHKGTSGIEGDTAYGFGIDSTCPKTLLGGFSRGFPDVF
jgi:hypothetical protein